VSSYETRRIAYNSLTPFNGYGIVQFSDLTVKSNVISYEIEYYCFFSSSFKGLFWPKEVCYEPYGCFKQILGLFQKLPQRPAEIGTTFHLFTRQNKQTAQNLDDAAIRTLKASNFRNSRRTIFVVHGFLGELHASFTL